MKPSMTPFAAITVTLKLKAWLMFLNGAMLIALLAINCTDYMKNTIRPRLTVFNN